MGKGADRNTQPVKETWTGREGPESTMPTSLQGIARIAEASISEEPGAGKLHAGICAGAAGQLAVLPR
jgi:hypothetical protein